VAYSYRILVDGAPVDQALYGSIASLEVEENVDLPGAFELTMAISTDGAGDYALLNDDQFRPHANLAVEVTVEGKDPACIFDGYVLAHKLHLDRGTSASTLKVWGQDASWLMNLEEKVKEWAEVTDGAVANAIFGEYGFIPGSDNLADDSASHSESGHTLMQRTSDIQFLRRLARRSGKICRIVPGSAAGEITGWFAKPKLDGEPEVVIPLNDPERSIVAALDFSWDVSRPTEVAARQALFNDPAQTGADGSATDAELPLLAERGLADFSGKPMKALLTAPADDAGELATRSQSLLREAAFFVRCSGEADLNAVGSVMRAGTVAQIDGAGSTHSGKYYVWSVRHGIQSDAYKMSFVLLRNALGPKPAAASGFPGGF
jgi:hypothetical protein